VKNSEKFTTAQEREEAIAKWCDRNKGSQRCQTHLCIDCVLAWLDLEAAEKVMKEAK